MNAPSLRQFTARMAAMVAAEYAEDPLSELMVWLHVALRRESSVGEIYGAANLERRIAAVEGPREIVSLLGTTIANVWAQEKAHAAYLEAALAAVASQPATLWRRIGARLDGIMGTMEGHILSGRTSSSPWRRVESSLLLAIGQRVQDVPSFVSALSSLSFRDFCWLNAELEITAVHGYERILALAGELGGASMVRDTTLTLDIARMVQDERFHNDVFRAMEEWFEPDGNALRANLSQTACSVRLADVRAAVYG